MTLPIIEDPLYGLIVLETQPQPAGGAWVDRTQYLTGLNYSEGGRLTLPGANTVDVGSLNASFKNLATVPAVGDFVRLRRAGTTEYAFTGFVQDVGQQIVFDNSVSFNTPITVTTLYCLDWVGYMTQWIVTGVGGRNASFVLATAGTGYEDASRIRAINYSFDSTNATQIISATADAGTVGSIQVADTDLVATASDHMDLLSRSTGMVWYGAHTIPTNNTTGRTSLIKWSYANGSPSSGKTFTDAVGSAGQLHYTEIDLESSSQNIANKISLSNRSLINLEDYDYAQLGGGNESNFIFVDGTTKQRGIIPEVQWSAQDNTSIAANSARQVQFDTNIYTPVDFTTFTVPTGTSYNANQIANGSVEYSDNGWGLGTNNRVRRRKPLEDPSPFAAYVGEWAVRLKHTASAAGQSSADYSGGESDGTPVTVGRYYTAKVWCARGAVSRTDLRATIRLNWYDDEEILGSSGSGTPVSLTTASTWYQATITAAAPANTTRATVTVRFQRSGGGNLTRGDISWIDGLAMYASNAAGTPSRQYADGDSSNSSTLLNVWTGQVGDSASLTLTNVLNTRATNLAATYGTTTVRATRIRWNAQEDLTSVSSLTVGKTISLVYDGTTTTYRIIGIDGTVDPDRYMIDYYLVKA